MSGVPETRDPDPDFPKPGGGGGRVGTEVEEITFSRAPSILFPIASTTHISYFKKHNQHNLFLTAYPGLF